MLELINWSRLIQTGQLAFLFLRENTASDRLWVPSPVFPSQGVFRPSRAARGTGGMARSYLRRTLGKQASCAARTGEH